MTHYALTYNGKILRVRNVTMTADFGDSSTAGPPTDPSSLILTFATDAYASPFDPTVTVSSGTVAWNLGDSSTYTFANSLNYSYASPGTKTVGLYAGTAGSNNISQLSVSQDDIVGVLDISCLTNLSSLEAFDNAILSTIINPVSSQPITNYQAYNCGLTGTLDLTGLSGLGGAFDVNSNANLAQIINPSSSQSFLYYYAYGCNLTGTLDLSSLSGFGGDFDVDYNSNLTQIINPVSAQSFVNYWAYGCDLTGTLDVSGLTGLSGSFDVDTNINLTKILNPVSSGIFTDYYAYDCSLNGTLDVSGLSNLAGILGIYRNMNLSEIILPTISQEFSQIDAHDCSLSQNTADDLFSKLNAWYSVNPPTQGLTLNIEDGRSMPCVDGYDNVDVSSLYNIFSNAGQYLAIKMNCQLLQFTTNSTSLSGGAGIITFGTVRFDMGDGTPRTETNYISNYAYTPGEHTVTMYSGSTKGQRDLNSLAFYYAGIVGTVDLSSFKNLTTIMFDNNPSLNYIINPVSSTVMSRYWAQNCNLLGTLDISGLTGLGAELDLSGNPNLTNVLNPNSSQTFSYYWIYDCNNITTLNLSGLTGLGGQLYVYNDTSLRTLIMPAITNAFSTIDASGCDLSTESVDDLLAKLDTYYLSNPPTAGLTVNLAHGTNSPPTDCSLNVNLVSLKSTFTSAAQYLAVEINPGCNDSSVVLMQFTTNAKASAFDPSVGVYSGRLTWDLGDSSSSVKGNSITHTYANFGDKTVRVLKGGTDGSILAIEMNSDNLVGTLDISSLTKLSNFNVATNASLNKILNPVTSQVYTNYRANNCGLTGTFDCSGMTGLGGVFMIEYNSGVTKVLNPITYQPFSRYSVRSCGITGVLDCSALYNAGGWFEYENNSGLTGVLNPSTNNAISLYLGYQCNLTGTLDMRKMTGLGGMIELDSNTNLNYILNPSSWNPLTEYQAPDCNLMGTLDISGFIDGGCNYNLWNNTKLNNIIFPKSTSTNGVSYSTIIAYNCGLMGTLDVSGLPNLGNAFRVYKNPSLNTILLPPSLSVRMSTFDASGCGLDLATVNSVLQKIDTYYTSTLPTGTVTINLSKGTNTSPTGGASNTNLLHIATSCASAGQTFTYYIN